jgi:ribonuclease T1
MASRKLRFAWVLLAAMLWLPAVSQASSQTGQAVQGEYQGLPVVALAKLPSEARNTLRAIKQGGPFTFKRDGAVFNNFERLLPKRQHGYYHEYTVPTPGTRSRGVRRIISGEAGEYYYTADHYQTFKRILE